MFGPCAPTARAEAPPPEKIFVGVYLNQLNSIDLKAGTFSADFWLWFRWSGVGASPLDTFEIIGGRVLSKSNVIKKKLPDGLSYDAARINASITKQWALAHFPFDDHTINIQIEDAERETARAVYTADKTNEGVDPSVSVSGWRIANHSDEVQEHVYHSNYGDTSIPTGAESHYSRYVFSVELERMGQGRFFKFFFGLFVATLASWCGFFIRPKDASPRVSVSIGALFAAAAVTLSINNQLPDVAYLTLADKMVFLSLGMILLSLVGTVCSLSLHYLGKESTHRTLDRVGAVAFPLLYAGILFAIVRG